MRDSQPNVREQQLVEHAEHERASSRTESNDDRHTLNLPSYAQKALKLREELNFLMPIPAIASAEPLPA